MNEDRKKILETIKKCLALGDVERNTNENEAETALRMAKKLMAEHNLSMADVAWSEANVGRIREEALHPRAGVPKWETNLAGVCDNLFNTRHFLRDTITDSFQQRRSVVFYGYDQDVSLSVEVYKLLKLEILGMALQWEVREAYKHSELTPGQLRTRRFSYCDGIIHNLRERSKREAEELSAVNAAKVRDIVIRKDSNLENWAKANLPPMQFVRRRDNGMHGDAEWEGNRDGNNMSLSFRSTVKGNPQSEERLGWNNKEKK